MHKMECELNFKEMWSIFKRYCFLILFVTALAMGITAAINYKVLPCIYEASSTILVSYKQNPETMITYNDIVTSQKLVNTYSEIIKSRSVLREVIETNGIEMNLNQLATSIHVEGVNDTELIKISVKNQDPLLAAQITNSLVEVFRDYIKETIDLNNVSIIDYADTPIVPVAPNKLLNIAMGGIIVFTIMVIAVFGFEYMNRKYNSPEDIIRYLDLQVIGVVPDFRPLEGSTIK